MSTLHLPNPCLLGIILTVTTHDGPQLVFHYPPNAKNYDYRAMPLSLDPLALKNEEDYYSSSSSDDEDLREKQDNYVSGKAILDLLDEQDEKRKGRERKKKELKRQLNANPRQLDNCKTSRSGSIATTQTRESLKQSGVDSNKVFGFEQAFLAEVLNPAKALCNSRFELTIDDMAFVGLPIRVLDSGDWRPHLKSKSRRSKRTNTDEGSDDESEREKSCPMTMFHVAFVMNPPVIEYVHRTDEMFHFIISRLSLLLRYEQDKSDYVWQQVSQLLKLKESLAPLSSSEMCSELIRQSELATSLARAFETISNSEIVSLEINGKARSLQIPIHNDFQDLPSRLTPVVPGSALSSVSPMSDLERFEEDDELIVHFALLLMDEPERVISDIKAEQNPVVSNLIRMIKPTQSLVNLASQVGLEIQQMIQFADHLCCWRRAKIIFPLQTRGVYIVSPIAPMKDVYKDSVTFREKFSSLMPLPQFLSLLSSGSSKPRHLSSIIPSRDHKELYLDAVAWLVMKGYVTELFSFMWLKIGKQIIMTVEEELEKEGFTRKRDSPLQKGNTDNTKKPTTAAAATADSADNSSKQQNVTPLTSQNNFLRQEEEDAILIDPQRATALERRWISKCTDQKPVDAVLVFHKMLKYMNGKVALETLLAREVFTRQEVRKFMHAFDECIVVTRHW